MDIISVMVQFARYGIDAPRVVCTLLVCAGLGIAAAIFCFSFSNRFFTWYFSVIALSFCITPLWMLYSSLFGKKKILSKFVSTLDLQGNERILDVGCGSGMFLIEIAKQLKTGKAVGIDLWYAKDQSKNNRTKTIQNGIVEGVSDRIEIQTADMCELPFADSTFDLVVSSLAIHNVKPKEQQQRALQEIMRVLKPGGKFAILDFQNTQRYADFLQQNGSIQVALSSQSLHYFPPLRSVTGLRTASKK